MMSFLQLRRIYRILKQNVKRIKKEEKPKDITAAYNTVKALRAKEHKASQSRHITILGIERPVNPATTRLYYHFKLLDRFRSRGFRRVVR